MVFCGLFTQRNNQNTFGQCCRNHVLLVKYKFITSIIMFVMKKNGISIACVLCHGLFVSSVGLLKIINSKELAVYGIHNDRITQ